MIVDLADGAIQSLCCENKRRCHILPVLCAGASVFYLEHDANNCKLQIRCGGVPRVVTQLVRAIRPVGPARGRCCVLQ